ncbi:hypothetical protein [Vibrio harveyi]|uniref:hypothetical protein n=1 Tax=Vibrio harveyi TaxID=669 RepID=UPI003CEFAD36
MINKKLLTVAMAAAMGLASPVMAADQDADILNLINKGEDTSVVQEAPVAKKVIAPVATVQVAETAKVEDGDVVVFDSGEALEAAKEYTVMQQKLKTLQVKLDIANTQNELSNAENASRVEKFKQENTALKLELEDVEKEFVDAMGTIESLKAEISSLRNQLSAAEAIQTQSQVLDDVYLLRIEGFGDNLEAHLYVNNDLLILKPGDDVTDSILLQKVTPDFAVISNGKMSKRLRVTTSQRAYERTIGTGGGSMDKLIGDTPFPAQ